MCVCLYTFFFQVNIVGNKQMCGSIISIPKKMFKGYGVCVCVRVCLYTYFFQVNICAYTDSLLGNISCQK